MSTLSTKTPLEQASEALEKARREHEEAHQEAEAARRTETAALNRLNAAQKAFDKAVDEVRKQSSPWNSEWWSARNRGTAETAS